jgi:Uncharacterized membrane protein, putative virulence factor
MLSLRTLQLIIFSILNLAFVVVTQLFTVMTIGPSSQTDALFAGMTIPTVILAVISGALTNVLVPLFVNVRDARIYLWQHIYIMLLGGYVLVIPLALTCHYWVGIVFPGFDHPTQELTAHIIITQLLALPLSLCSAIFTAYLNSQSKFLSAECIAAICSLVVFPLIFIFVPKYGVLATSYLYIAKTVGLLLVQVIIYSSPMRVSLRTNEIKESYSKIKPLLLGSIYYKSGPLIDRNILSHTTSGTMSIFILAQQLLAMGNLVLTKSLVVPQITVLNTLAGDKSTLAQWVFKKVCVMFLLGLGLFILFLIIGHPILEIVFELLGYSNIDLGFLWLITIALFGTFIGDFTATLISSVYYALGDTRSPSYISMITYTIFIPLKYVSFYFIGVYGLASICSIYSITNLVILFLFINKRIS